jgi:hypothetical protein
MQQTPQPTPFNYQSDCLWQVNKTVKLNKPPWGRRAAHGDAPLDGENRESHTAGRQKPFGLPAIKLA